MKTVFIGKGKLAGKGVYAARDFKKGELVVRYKLKELSQEEFGALPEGEWEWTHSFYGKIFLFPEPERYVNNDENPSCFIDRQKGGNVALRDIKKGEAITINDKFELQYELDTFLKAYEEASNSCDFKRVDPLIADHATYWFTNGTFKGKTAIRKAFEDTWARIKDEKYTIREIEWVATNYWVSVCTYKFTSDGTVDGKRQIFEGKGTSVLKRIRGNWRVVHEHLSKKVS
jgi:ketosteroid isomerase-like protein